MLPLLTDIVIFEVNNLVASFADTVKDLSFQLNKDGTSIVAKLMPLLDNYLYAESAVGALAYQLWDEYPAVSKNDMEVYTDAIIKLGSDLAETIAHQNLYNTEGTCMYMFERMLGPDVVMRLKDLPPSERQIF